jgi:VanZ like family
MKQTNSDLPQSSPSRNWSNRILAGSLFGILFFTLFPYWIDFGQRHGQGRSPFLLGGPLKFDGILHTFLNALLFVPFGFALSQFFGGRRKSTLKSLAIAVVAGAALSYSIEITQLYIPSRDSAWDDLVANTAGALAGAIFASISGRTVWRILSDWESRLEKFLSFRKILITALIYFSVWLAVSVPLQRKSRLDNWNSNSFLIVGYDIVQDTRWPGTVSHLQIWDRSLTANQAIRLSGGGTSNDGLSAGSGSGLLASYDVLQPPPIPDNAGGLPNLALRPITTIPDLTHNQIRDSFPVLMSKGDVHSLASAVAHSNQVTVLVDCVPAGGNGTVGAILDITNLSGKPDFYLKQDHSGLVIYLRNGLDNAKAQLAWFVPGIFTKNLKSSIVFSYDGARASVFIDGKTTRQSAYFSPGAALVRTMIRNKSTELIAYSGLYDSLIFLPIGFLLGLAARITPRGNVSYRLTIFAALLLPSIALEALLMAISGRRVSFIQVGASICLTIAGMIWMNLDSSLPGPTQ